LNDYGFSTNLNGNPIFDNGKYEVFINANHKTSLPYDFGEIHEINGTYLSSERVFTISSNVKLTVSNSYTQSDVLKNVIHHEFYHGIQYSFSPDFFNSTSTSLGKFLWLIEGQARFIETVLNPEEFIARGNYYTDVNIKLPNCISAANTSSLTSFSYGYAMFWRYLFENFSPNGNLIDKMAIIRSCLSGYTSPDLASIEQFMDQKLMGGNNFSSFDGAIKRFAKRVYFNDPEYGLWSTQTGQYTYANPPMLKENVSFRGDNVEIPGTLNTSFGYGFLEVDIEKAGDLRIILNTNQANDPAKYMDVYCNIFYKDVARFAEDHIIKLTQGKGELTLPNLFENDQLIVVLARIDNKEVELSGPLSKNFTLRLEPKSGKKLQANFDMTNKSKSAMRNTSVTFNDISNPGDSPIVSWEWTFPGQDPSTSTEQKPIIRLSSAGIFPISLKVRNSNEEDFLLRSDYLCVTDWSNPGSNDPWVFISDFQEGYSTNDPAWVNLYIEILQAWTPYTLKVTNAQNWGGMGGTVLFHESGLYEPFYNFREQLWPGSYTVTVLLSDANGYDHQVQYPLNVGLPGGQKVSFSYNWEGGQDFLGVDSWTTFTNETTEGFKPYLFCEWTWGNEINSNIAPIPENGWNWENVANLTNDPIFTGNPTKRIKFPEVGDYPVTLKVTDNYGFSASVTKLLTVKAAPECLKLYDAFDFCSNGNTWTNKIKIDNQPTLIYYPIRWEYFDNFNQTCIAAASQTANGNGKYVTDWRFKLFKNNQLLQNNTAVFDEWWGSNHTDWGDWFYGAAPFEKYYLNYTFTQKGEYKLVFDAWNRLFHTDPNILTPANKSNFEMYDVLERTLYAIDCNEEIEINQDQIGILDKPIYSGSFVFANNSPVSINTLRHYEACESIIFNPGTSILAGSIFKAVIDPIHTSSCNKIGFRDIHTQKLVNDSYEIVPNPCNGMFRIKSIRSGSNDLNIKILNALGQTTGFNINKDNEMLVVQLLNSTPGFYFVQICNSTDLIDVVKLVVF
jgi:PKD repeat protein